jgi:hypothetical protein
MGGKWNTNTKYLMPEEVDKDPKRHMPLISILINGQQPPSVAMPTQVGLVSTVH